MVVMVKDPQKLVTYDVWITYCFHRQKVPYSILGQKMYFYSYPHLFFFFKKKVVLSFLQRTTKNFIYYVSLKKSFSMVLSNMLQNHFLMAEYSQSFLVAFLKLIFLPCFYMRPLFIFQISLCQQLTQMLCASWCNNSLTWTNPFPAILRLHPSYSGCSSKQWLFFIFHAVKYDAMPMCCVLNDLQRSVEMKQKTVGELNSELSFLSNCRLTNLPFLFQNSCLL